MTKQTLDSSAVIYLMFLETSIEQEQIEILVLRTYQSAENHEIMIK